MVGVSPHRLNRTLRRRFGRPDLGHRSPARNVTADKKCKKDYKN
jgi:hypothetical protein